MMDSQFAEGTMSLGTGTWFCIAHSQTMKVGRECPWCAQETLTDAQFAEWMDTQTI